MDQKKHSRTRQARAVFRLHWDRWVQARGPRVVGRPAVSPSDAFEQPQTAEEEAATVVLCARAEEEEAAQ